LATNCCQLKMQAADGVLSDFRCLGGSWRVVMEKVFDVWTSRNQEIDNIVYNIIDNRHNIIYDIANKWRGGVSGGAANKCKYSYGQRS